MTRDQKAKRLKRITTINTVYSLVMVVILIGLAVWAASGGWEAIPACLVLFGVKGIIVMHWEAAYADLRKEIG